MLHRYPGTTGASRLWVGGCLYVAFPFHSSSQGMHHYRLKSSTRAFVFAGALAVSAGVAFAQTPKTPADNKTVTP